VWGVLPEAVGGQEGWGLGWVGVTRSLSRVGVGFRWGLLGWVPIGFSVISGVGCTCGGFRCL